MDRKSKPSLHHANNARKLTPDISEIPSNVPLSRSASTGNIHECEEIRFFCLDARIPMSTINIEEIYITTYLPCVKLIGTLEYQKFHPGMNRIKLETENCALLWNSDIHCFYLETGDPVSCTVNLSIPHSILEYHNLLYTSVSEINYQVKSLGSGIEKYNYTMKSFTPQKIVQTVPHTLWQMIREGYFLIPIPLKHNGAIWKWLRDIESLSE